MASPRNRLLGLIAATLLAAQGVTLAALLLPRGPVQALGIIGCGLLLLAAAALLVRACHAVARREARLEQDAYQDPLTGLPNRAFVEGRLDELLRASDAAGALIVLEIRNVREINASLGHLVGDDALREVARRARGSCAATDLVARLAANQFLVVADRSTLERALQQAAHLTALARADLHLPSVSPDLQANAGVCRYPEHGGTTRELLRRAQIAVEDAAAVRTHVAAYRPGRDEEQHRRLALAGDLRAALEHDGLQLAFQPEISLATGAVSGLEALVRWTHPELGSVAPSEFVPIAEASGSSRRLTSWAVNAALRQMALWHALGFDIDVAVNLSAPDIIDPQLVDEILEAQQRHGVEAGRLVLEITESAVMRDAAVAARNMKLLRIAGLRFAVDDFGTGHSALSQLNRLPLDFLKIDRSFITHAHERPGDALIVRSTIELAHNMDLKVIAEGVENPATLDLLRTLGCDFVQGELLSPPLPPEQVPAFLRR